MSTMEVPKEDLSEMDIGSSVESIFRLVDSQQELFHSQIDQLQNIVVTQCKLTGANPLSQEMAAGALSINIGRRPRDLLNPKAVKYMQSVFSIKDAISKKESREISALFGVTVTQVRDYFTSQRSRVRKSVLSSKEKATRLNTSKESDDGVPTSSDPLVPIDLVPLNSIAPTTREELPSCPTQDQLLLGIDDSDKNFAENIFTMMRKEEVFSGQVKLMEWILQIENPSVLHWFLSKGGLMILTTWLSEAAIEEQTSVLLVNLKVLCHLPLQKALPLHMSAILQSVNQLRFYRASDIANKARVLLSRWSKIFSRSQAAKKVNGMKSHPNEQKDIILRQSNGGFMDYESWQSNIDSEHILGSHHERKLEPPQVLRLMPASADDQNKKHIRDIRGRRKVQLMEQPGQYITGRHPQVTRVVPANPGRPMSADDIQKAKLRAQYMQNKYGKVGSVSSEGNEPKTESPNKSLITRDTILHQASKVHGQPNIVEHKKPFHVQSIEEHKKPCQAVEEHTPLHVQTIEEHKRPFHAQAIEEHKQAAILPSKVSNTLESTLISKLQTGSKEYLLEKCKTVQIPWQTPTVMKLLDAWRVSTGENSKEVEVQENRNHREKETIYHTIQEIPSNPKDPWDIDMDYDDTLTPLIPDEQLPDADGEEAQVSHSEDVNHEILSTPSASRIVDEHPPEPDLELLAALLKNPELVFALTSGKAGNLSSEDTMKLLDMIKSGGVGPADNLNGSNGEMEEKVEVSLPSPTPSSNPGTSPWRAEVVRNPFTQQGLRANSNSIVSVNHATENLYAPSSPLAQIPATNITPPPVINPPVLHQAWAAIPSHSFPRANSLMPNKQPRLSLQQSHPINSSGLPTVLNPNLTSAAISTLSNSQPAQVSRTERLHIPYSAHLQPQPLQHHPLLSRAQNIHQTPVYSSAIPIVKPVSNSWRTRQSIPSNSQSQANKNNSNPSYRGPVQSHMVPGQWETNERVDGEFETWSPENSPLRTTEHHHHVSERNYTASRMNSGLNLMPDRSRQPNSSGHSDYERNNTDGRWRGRRR